MDRIIFSPRWWTAACLLLSAIYLLIQMSVYGVIFYLPQQVAALLGTTVGLRVGLVAALPWLCAVGRDVVRAASCGSHGWHRRWAVALLVLAGIGIGASGLAHNPSIGLIALCCAASGFIAAQPLFWTFPTRYLTGAAAAGGIALINSLGGLGGFIAPKPAHRGGTGVFVDLGRADRTGRVESAGGADDRHAVARDGQNQAGLSNTYCTAPARRIFGCTFCAPTTEPFSWPCLLSGTCVPSSSAAAVRIITINPARHWIDDHISTPMARYPEYRQSRQSFGINVLGTLVVEIEASDGTVGFAVTTGGEIGAFIVEKHLARFLEGQLVTDIEKMWDQMYFSTLYYGRKGVVLNTISGVDLALWDLLAKVRKEPVYQLLGGPVRDELRVLRDWRASGSCEGDGFHRRENAVAAWSGRRRRGSQEEPREARRDARRVGDDFWLMYDCWMSLDVTYATRLADAAHEYGLKWLEETLSS